MALVPLQQTKARLERVFCCPEDAVPRQYEAIRDKFEAQGVSPKAAKSHAAAIYNSQHPGRPVTGKSDAEKASGTRKLASALIGR